MATRGFAVDIRKLFRESDVSTMKRYGIDLSKYDDVKKHANDIYSRLVEGDMPCDNPWSPEWLGIFKEWIDGGMQT